MDETTADIGDEDSEFGRDPHGRDPHGLDPIATAQGPSDGDTYSAGAALADGLDPIAKVIVVRPSATEADIEAALAAASGDTPVDTPDGRLCPDVPDDTLRQLAEAAGCLDLAEDAVRAVNPGDSPETMAAHQLAASHALAMRFTGRAMALSAEPDRPRWQRFADSGPHDPQAAQAAQSAARMMGAYRANLLMLDRLRHGNRLTITVERPDG